MLHRRGGASAVLHGARQMRLVYFFFAGVCNPLGIVSWAPRDIGSTGTGTHAHAFTRGYLHAHAQQWRVNGRKKDGGDGSECGLHVIVRERTTNDCKATCQCKCSTYVTLSVVLLSSFPLVFLILFVLRFLSLIPPFLILSPCSGDGHHERQNTS